MNQTKVSQYKSWFLPGGIVIVVAHRPSVLEGVDYVLALVNGAVYGFGPKDEVLQRVLPRRSTAVAEVAHHGRANEVAR